MCSPHAVFMFSPHAGLWFRFQTANEPPSFLANGYIFIAGLSGYFNQPDHSQILRQLSAWLYGAFR